MLFSQKTFISTQKVADCIADTLLVFTNKTKRKKSIPSTRMLPNINHKNYTENRFTTSYPTRKRCPALNFLREEIPFIDANFFTLIPFLRAILAKVSPFLTLKVRALYFFGDEYLVAVLRT